MFDDLLFFRVTYLVALIFVVPQKTKLLVSSYSLPCYFGYGALKTTFVQRTDQQHHVIVVDQFGAGVRKRKEDCTMGGLELFRTYLAQVLRRKAEVAFPCLFVWVDLHTILDIFKFTHLPLIISNYQL